MIDMIDLMHEHFTVDIDILDDYYAKINLRNTVGDHTDSTSLSLKNRSILLANCQRILEALT